MHLLHSLTPDTSDGSHKPKLASPSPHFVVRSILTVYPIEGGGGGEKGNKCGQLF